MGAEPLGGLHEQAVVLHEVMQYYPTPGVDKLVLGEADYARLFPEEMPLVPAVGSDGYRISDSFEEVCDASIFGKVLRGLLTCFLPFAVKGGKANPTFHMMLVSLMESPLEALPALSGRIFRPGLAGFLVKAANWERRFRKN